MHGGGGNGNGGDTPRSNVPRGATANSGFWGAVPGSGGGGRLPPVSEAGAVAAAAGGDGVEVTVATAAVAADQGLGSAMPPPSLKGRSDGAAGSSQATETPLHATPLAAAKGTKPYQAGAGDKSLRGGRPDHERQQHSGSGGSSNSPDEGTHGQRDAGEPSAMHSDSAVFHGQCFIQFIIACCACAVALQGMVTGKGDLLYCFCDPQTVLPHRR